MLDLAPNSSISSQRLCALSPAPENPIRCSRQRSIGLCSVPTVSVVIPTYNRAELIPATLDSVFSQTFQYLEVVVVDDGSTDNTLEVLGRYGSAIRVVRQANQGEGAARNAGIDAARGKYIAFVDSDDLWEPSKLLIQMRALQDSNEGMWIYCLAYAFESDTMRVQSLLGDTDPIHEGFVGSELIKSNFIPSPTVVVRKRALSEVGGFSSLRMGADWELWLRIAAKYPILRVPQVLAGYRLHPGMISGTTAIEDQLMDRLDVVERAGSWSPNTYQRHLGKARAVQWLGAGVQYLERGMPSESRRAYLMAIKHWPLAARPYVFFAASLLGAGFYVRLRRVYRARRRKQAGW